MTILITNITLLPVSISHLTLKKQKTTTKRTCAKTVQLMDTWVAQSVKHPTLGFGSGPGLRTVRSSSASGSKLSHGVCLRFSLSLSLCPSPHSLSRSLLKKKDCSVENT